MQYLSDVTALRRKEFFNVFSPASFGPLTIRTNKADQGRQGRKDEY